MHTPAIEVVPHPDGWAIRREGARRSARIFPTQAAAERAARRRARRLKTELIIKDRHGRIERRDSYGHDPFPPRG